MTKKYDAIIIGSGQSGFPLAGRLADEGWKTALIEKDVLGGTCVNVGCSPTKTIIASARAAHLARRGADFGVQAGPITVDMKKVKARKDQIVTQFRGGLEDWLQNLENLDVIYGHAHFEGENTVRVNDALLEADHIFINTGQRGAIPPIDGLQDVDYLTNVSILDLEDVPDHLIILGGSYIGLEFGQAFRRFGATVTIIESADTLVHREDNDIAESIRGIMENEGITILVGTTATAVTSENGRIIVSVDDGEETQRIVGSHLLVAVGRRPNSDDLGLDVAGIKTDKRGYIVVDDELKTSNPYVWATGDVNGKGAFTHTSWNDYEIVASNLLDGGSRRVSDRFTTYGLFIDPPLGRVGMTEQQARESGRNVLMAIKPMSHIARAKERDEKQGFIKILVDADTERFLGAAILGIGGDELVHAITDSMYADVSYTIMKNAVHIHPTVSELLPTILGELKPLEAYEAAAANGA
jgi:pyruvate/2-oxoglutarate dehydrogenase complex dihydrolipoamide dehydrogenase (E3) component